MAASAAQLSVLENVMARTAKIVVTGGLIDLSLDSMPIRAKIPTAQQLARARGAGKRAAITLAGALAESGIDMTFEPGTPVFSIDAQDPNLVIRQLDGQVTRGYFKGGKFVKVL